MELTQLLAKYRVLPMVDASKRPNLYPVVGALGSGGIPLLCIRMEESGGVDMLASVIRTFEDLQLGAWVTGSARAKECIEAGVKFICTPGVCEKTAKLCREGSVRYLPGCATPTDVMKASELSLSTVMITPAEALGGSAALDLFIAMFPEVRFIACPFTSEAEIAPYFENPRLLAVATSALTRGTLDEIAKSCQQFVASFSRGGGA